VTIAWVNIVLMLACVWSAWSGYSRGLVVEALSLGRLAVAVVLGARYGMAAGTYIQQYAPLPAPFASPLGAVLIFLSVMFLLGAIIGVVFRPLIGTMHLIPVVGCMDRLCGMVISVVQTVVLIALGLAALLPLTHVLALGPVAEGINESRLATTLATVGSQLAPNVEAMLGTSAAEWDTSSLFPAQHVESDQQVKMHFPPNLTLKPDVAAEAAMLDYVNAQRIQRNLAPLVADSQLAAVARAHSEDMFRRSYFAHATPDGLSPFDRMRAAKIRYQVAGENIAYAPNVAMANDGLIHSPEHRDNILRPEFRRVGMGVMSAGSFEEMFTQDFAG